MPVQLTISGGTIARVLLGLVIGAAFGGLVWLGIFLFCPEDPFAGRIHPDRWQAIFISNNEVYFGHLVDAGEDFYELQDAYFIQESPPAEEGTPSTREVQPITTQFHQPEPSMLIAKEFVIRVENLLPDSDVAEAIERVEAAGQ